MTGQETSWLWGTSLIALVLGVILGIGMALFFMQKYGRVKKLQQEVDRLEQELTEYKSQVTDHFKTTSTLVQKMTESYRDVYQHLANSSQQLCQEPIEMFKLGQQNKEPEKLLTDKPADSPSSFNTPLDDLLGGKTGTPQ